jgi:hypothetical protein
LVTVRAFADGWTRFGPFRIAIETGAVDLSAETIAYTSGARGDAIPMATNVARAIAKRTVDEGPATLIEPARKVA